MYCHRQYTYAQYQSSSAIAIYSKDTQRFSDLDERWMGRLYRRGRRSPFVVHHINTKAKLAGGAGGKKKLRPVKLTDQRGSEEGSAVNGL